MTLLKCVEIEPKQQPAIASVIWLHGLGADGHDFAPIVPALNIPLEKAVRFIFPHAPSLPVTINNGFIMPAWFDILTLDREHPVDEEGVYKSIADIEALISRENERGVPSDKIILAGFSQGGAVALLTALRYPEKLGGLMGLSTYLPLQEKLAKERSKANLDIPIFLAHGLYDPVLSINLGLHSRACLERLGYKPQWHEYPMEHSVSEEEISNIGLWLRNLPALK